MTGMKRDMELIREILLAIEASETTQGIARIVIPSRTPAEVSYNVKLLAQAGLIDAIDMSSSAAFCWQPKSLTWSGHEFLDAARNDTIWNKAMTKLKDQAASVPFEVLKTVVLQASKEFFGV
jgi:hypothetical protein